MEITAQDLMKVLQQMVQKSKPATKRTKGNKKPKGRQPLTEEQKAAYRTQNDLECVKVFTEKGYANVQPRVNVMTYNKWIEAGRKVKKGEKSVKVGAFSLFHKDQTEEIASPAPASPGDSVTKH